MTNYLDIIWNLLARYVSLSVQPYLKLLERGFMSYGVEQVVDILYVLKRALHHGNPVPEIALEMAPEQILGKDLL